MVNFKFRPESSYSQDELFQPCLSYKQLFWNANPVGAVFVTRKR